MQLLTNIYVVLFCLVMPFIVKYEEPFGVLSVGYGVLAGGYLIYKHSKGSEFDIIIEKLNDKLKGVDKELDEGKGGFEIANDYYKSDSIPPIFTIKNLLYIIKEACNEHVLPYTHVLDRKAPSDTGVIDLLQKVVSDFKKNNNFSPKDTFSKLSEFENVFFIQENIKVFVEKDSEEKVSTGGVVILTLNELVFIPTKWDLLKNVDKSKLFEILHKSTASFPFLNLGIVTSEVLLGYNDISNSDKCFFNDKRKSEFEKDYIENKGWYIPYSDMEEFNFDYKRKQWFRPIEQSIRIVSKGKTYSFCHAQNEESFRVEFLDQLLLANLLHLQVFYPVFEKYEGFIYKCELVPQSEIDYDDPNMKAFREQEMANQ